MKENYEVVSWVKMSFDPSVAKNVGTDAAIILSNIEYWCKLNKSKNINYEDGKYWTYNSAKSFSMQFDYLSIPQIERCLKKLEEAEYIITGNFNKSKYDRTKWYSSGRVYKNDDNNEEPKSIDESNNQNVNSNLPNGKMDFTEYENGSNETDAPIPNKFKTNKLNTNKLNTNKNKAESSKEDILSIYNCYIENFRKNPNMYKLTHSRKEGIKQLINVCYKEDKDADAKYIMEAIKNAKHNEWFIEQNFDLSYFYTYKNQIYNRVYKWHEYKPKSVNSGPVFKSQIKS